MADQLSGSILDYLGISDLIDRAEDIAKSHGITTGSTNGKIDGIPGTPYLIDIR